MEGPLRVAVVGAVAAGRGMKVQSPCCPEDDSGSAFAPRYCPYTPPITLAATGPRSTLASSIRSFAPTPPTAPRQAAIWPMTRQPAFRACPAPMLKQHDDVSTGSRHTESNGMRHSALQCESSTAFAAYWLAPPESVQVLC